MTATTSEALPGPPVGPAAPLTAAYCAERAAAAIHQAGPIPHDGHLHIADRWMRLGELMSQNIGMTRPRDDNNTDGRR